jgi:hypothetical protein
VEFRDNDVTDDEISSIMEQLSQLAGSTGDNFLFLACPLLLYGMVQL